MFFEQLRVTEQDLAQWPFNITLNQFPKSKPLTNRPPALWKKKKKKEEGGEEEGERRWRGKEEEEEEEKKMMVHTVCLNVKISDRSCRKKRLVQFDLIQCFPNKLGYETLLSSNAINFPWNFEKGCSRHNCDTTRWEEPSSSVLIPHDFQELLKIPSREKLYYYKAPNNALPKGGIGGTPTPGKNILLWELLKFLKFYPESYCHVCSVNPCKKKKELDFLLAFRN